MGLRQIREQHRHDVLRAHAKHPEQIGCPGHVGEEFAIGHPAHLPMRRHIAEAGQRGPFPVALGGPSKQIIAAGRQVGRQAPASGLDHVGQGKDGRRGARILHACATGGAASDCRRLSHIFLPKRREPSIAMNPPGPICGWATLDTRLCKGIQGPDGGGHGCGSTLPTAGGHDCFRRAFVAIKAQDAIARGVGGPEALKGYRRT